MTLPHPPINPRDSTDIPPASFRDRVRLRYRAWKLAHGRCRGEIAALKRLELLGRCAVDVGAHKGAFTWWLRRAVGPAGVVAAFEPQPDLAENLSRLTVAFGWQNVTVVPGAVSSSGGSGRLFVPTPGSPGASLCVDDASCRAIHVPILRLDEWISRHRLPPPSFIKMDCEGHELEALYGCGALLSRRPSLLLELERRHHGEEKMMHIMHELRLLGYSGSFFWHGREVPVSRFVPAEHQQEGTTEFWKSPGYVNNFLFVAGSGCKSILETRADGRLDHFP